MSASLTDFTVGIFEDNPVVIDGLRVFLQERSKYDFKVVLETPKPEEFLEKIQSQQPDILIIDIITDAVMGLELFEEVFNQNPKATVIAYSNVRSQHIIKALISLGVSAFIPKTEPLSVFEEAFEAILRDRRLFLPPSLKHIQPQKRLPVVLTATEKQIVPLLLEGLSSKEIASKLFVSSNTVNFHKKNLFEKFEVNSIAAFVKEVIAQGYAGGIHY